MRLNKRLIIVGLLIVSARGEVVFTTMSPGFQPAAGGGSPHGGAWVFKWDQDGSYSGEVDPAIDFKGYRYFAGFTAPTGSDYSLTAITLSLARSLADANSENIKISLYSASGNLPDLAAGPLETFTGFSVPAIPAYTVTDLPSSSLILSSSENPILHAGSTYFVSLEPEFENTTSTADDATYFWYHGDVNRSGIKVVDYYYVSNGGWSNMTGFATANEMNGITVTGAAIPEPSTYASAIGLVALAVSFVQRRKRALRRLSRD